jgi:hypothetical protein
VFVEILDSSVRREVVVGGKMVVVEVLDSSVRREVVVGGKMVVGG